MKRGFPLDRQTPDSGFFIFRRADREHPISSFSSTLNGLAVGHRNRVEYIAVW